MRLDAAAVEAAKKWRFATSETERSQELVFEFRTLGYCDPEPPPFQRIGNYRMRVWKQQEKPDMTTYAMIVDQAGWLQCVMTAQDAPQCAF